MYSQREKKNNEERAAHNPPHALGPGQMGVAPDLGDMRRGPAAGYALVDEALNVAGGLWVPGDELDRWFWHDEQDPNLGATMT